MKKPLTVAVGLSVMTLSSAASALKADLPRDLWVQGFGRSFASLGTMSFVALGRAGSFCEYLAAWESPFNPNQVQLCVLDELRTPFTPSCLANEQRDVTTIVHAGPGSHAGYCDGFDIKGEAVANVTILMAEGPLGLQGVVISPGFYPTIYPVLAR